MSAPDQVFRLYLMGETVHGTRARENLQALCEENLAGRFQIEVVDLAEDIQLAEDRGIFATPTLERVQPAPALRILGDLSDRDEVLRKLGLG